MDPIARIFNSKRAFIGYVTGGDGGIDYCVDCCLQLVQGGVDILEIGFPFSDPVADGPVIQQASMRSLKRGTTSSTMLEIAKKIRKETDTPLILFSYYNPLLKKGEAYLKDLRIAGFDAVLIVDLPDSFESGELNPIRIVAPSTAQDRLCEIGRHAAGFLYYACQKGTTGMRTRLPDDFSFHIARIRKATHLPIAAGFGIADRESAREVLKHADGFIVGSAFVKLIEQKADPVKLKLLAQSIDPRSRS